MIVMSNPEHSELFPRGKHWNFVFVKVYTDAGIDGVGEGFASGRFRIGALGVLGVGLAAETDA